MLLENHLGTLHEHACNTSTEKTKWPPLVEGPGENTAPYFTVTDYDSD